MPLNAWPRSSGAQFQGFTTLFSCTSCCVTWKKSQRVTGSFCWMGHIPNIVACALLGATRHRHLRLIKLKFETFLLHVHCAVNCCWIAMSRGQWSAFGLPPLPPRQQLSAFARCPVSTAIFYVDFLTWQNGGYTFTWVQLAYIPDNCHNLSLFSHFLASIRNANRFWNNGWILTFKVSKRPYRSHLHDRFICKWRQCLLGGQKWN